MQAFYQVFRGMCHLVITTFGFSVIAEYPSSIILKNPMIPCNKFKLTSTCLKGFLGIEEWHFFSFEISCLEIITFLYYANNEIEHSVANISRISQQCFS